MNMPLAIAFTSPTELWPIAIVVIVLFGAKKIPEMAKGLGLGLKEFKKATKEFNIDDEPAAVAPPATTAASTPEEVEKRIVS